MSTRRKRTRRDSPHPSAAEIAAARAAASLTQTQAAELIYSTLRTWQDWEAGIAKMHPAIFELFRIKTGQTRRAA